MAVIWAVMSYKERNIMYGITIWHIEVYMAPNSSQQPILLLIRLYIKQISKYFLLGDKVSTASF